MRDIEQIEKGELDFRPLMVKSTEIAVILFSSGTTSAPKGICLTHWALLNNVRLLPEHHLVKPGVCLHFSSFYWISAWRITTLCIITGTAKVIAPSINALQFLNIIEKHKVTYVFSSSMFTYQVTDLAEDASRKYDTSSLYSWSIGGSPMDPKQILRLRQYFPHSNINLYYGATECCSIIAHNCTNERACKEKVSSSGTVLPETEVKFLDEHTGQLLGPNLKGEIRIKSPFLMSGYFRYSNPDAVDEDGFLKLGDLGYYDEEGYVYITDRISEVFKYKTTQVSPTILEQVLLQHPAVNEAVVFGVPHAVDRYHPAACVVLKTGPQATPKELQDFVNSRVADPYQLRDGVLIVESIPRTPTGKYQRRAVRDDFIKFLKNVAQA